MDRRPFYVSVQAGTIMEKQGDAAYEFEIEATPEQLELLQEQFEELMEWDHKSHFRAMTPGVAYHNDTENDEYDRCLQGVYAKLYKLGTAETKQHIKSMGILH